ncbi:MAG TPA: hypothetical protein VGJ44_15810 [Kribbellaceae bacterium]
MTVTDSRHSPATPPGAHPRVPAQPLLPEDPPRIGGFWLRGRVSSNAAGLVYAATDDEGRPVALAMMAEGAADDAAARDRFRHAVDQLPEDVVLDRNGSYDDDRALWVAMPDGRPAAGEAGAPADDGAPAGVSEAAREQAAAVLSAVLMDRIPHVGRWRGPDFLHYWDGRRRPGLFRLWPLPWPAILRAASRLALLFSLLTMMLLMGLAILIAWLLFRNQPQVDPGPLVPGRTVTTTVTPSSGQTRTVSPSPTDSGSPTTRPTTPPSSSSSEGIPTRLPSSASTPTNPGDRF